LWEICLQTTTSVTPFQNNKETQTTKIKTLESKNIKTHKKNISSHQLFKTFEREKKKVKKKQSLLESK